MAAVLLKTERAIQRWVLGSAAYLIAGDGSFVVTDNGLKIRLVSGFEFDLPVMRGQDDVENSGPGVIAACAAGVQVEKGTMTHDVQVEITLRYPADEGEGLCSLLDSFEFSCDQLSQAIYRADFPAALTASLDGFTCLSSLGHWRQASGWVGRLRSYQFTGALRVAPFKLSP